MKPVRSNRPEVRNPVLGLPATALILEMPPATRRILADLLADISRDARRRAQESWKRNKAPMAVYWKAVGAYATHLSRVVRP